MSGERLPHLGMGTIVDSESGFVDKPRDHCGVVGMYAPGEPVALMTFQALQELQHRGQGGAGVMVYDKHIGVTGHKGLGLVHEALPELTSHVTNGRSALDMMTHSPAATGHVRYPTSTGVTVEASHPFTGDKNSIALSLNGHIEDMSDIARRWGVDPEMAVNDAHLATMTLDAATSVLGSLERAVKVVMPEVNGAYCLTMIHKDRLIAVRDPWGFHPLSLGRLPDRKGYVVASEPAAYETLGGAFVRDIEPGEILTIDAEGVRSDALSRKEPRKECLFEYAYTSRPDSTINGVDVYAARKEMGRILAQRVVTAMGRELTSNDVVIGVPDSGLQAAAGFAEELGLPFVQGIIKNPYVTRSFIETGLKREDILRRKQRVIRSEVEGRDLWVVDDSVIKGNTMKALIRILREAGATEVNILSAAPKYLHPCYAGMDTGDPRQLIARNKTNEEIADAIGADSVHFSRVEDVEKAVEKFRAGGSIARLGKLCTACATGEYPFPAPPEVRGPVLMGMPTLGGAGVRLAV